MLKEIYEQPDAVARDDRRPRPPRRGSSSRASGSPTTSMRDLRRIVILACGTAYHAGVVGRYVIEEWARVPVEPDIASEWRYRNPVLDEDTLVIGISQSGETRRHDRRDAARARDGRAHARDHEHDGHADHARGRLGALHARRPRDGRRRLEDVHRAGRALYLIALKLAQVRGTLPPDEIDGHARRGPRRCRRRCALFLDGDHPIEEIAQRHYDKPFFLYLGRHIGLPVCLEGALKLKEISYIPTEAYSAGEMKHGPIALLDEDTPVVVRRDRHRTSTTRSSRTSRRRGRAARR